MPKKYVVKSGGEKIHITADGYKHNNRNQTVFYKNEIGEDNSCTHRPLFVFSEWTYIEFLGKIKE